MAMQHVLGIDQSLSGTGLFWVVSGAPKWLLISPKKLRGGQRLLYIKNAIEGILDAQNPPFELAAAEGYSYGGVGRVFQLGELGGVIKTLLTEHEIPYITPAPVQVKKFATGSHLASKEEMVTWANKTFQLSWTIKENDLADASALWAIANAYLDPSTVTERCKKETIKALRSKDSEATISSTKPMKTTKKHKFPNI